MRMLRARVRLYSWSLSTHSKWSERKRDSYNDRVTSAVACGGLPALCPRIKVSSSSLIACRKVDLMFQRTSCCTATSSVESQGSQLRGNVASWSCAGPCIRKATTHPPHILSKTWHNTLISNESTELQMCLINIEQSVDVKHADELNTTLYRASQMWSLLSGSSKERWGSREG